jgi:hypothetical protein
MRRNFKTIMASGAAGIALLVGAGMAAPAVAQDATPPATQTAPAGDVAAQLEALKTIVLEQQAALRNQQARIDAQQRQIEAQSRVLQGQMQALRQAGIGTTTAPTQPAVPPIASATGGPTPPVQLPPASQPPATPPPTEMAQATPPVERVPGASPPPPPADGTGERANSERQADALLVDAGGVLLPRGTVQIEPGFDWTAISSDRVNISGFVVFNAINIGTITVDDINRNIYNTSLSARAGLGHRLQIEGRVPWQWRIDRETRQVGTPNAVEREWDGSDVGDAELTLSWQPISANDWVPAVITRVRTRFPTGKSVFEIPTVPVPPPPGQTTPGAERRVPERASTGSGFYSVNPGATMVWRVDPVVLFAGGGYTYTFGRTFNGAKISPGDVIDGFVGLNLALNERVSFNTSFAASQTYGTRVVGRKQLGTSATDARLSVGSSIGLTDRVSLVMGANVGLTDESPDFSFSFSLPITFQRVW